VIRAFARAALTLVAGAAMAAGDPRAGEAGDPRAGEAGDPRAGEAIYERCAACHSLAHDRAGPRHCGLLGRRAGSVPGFEYSEAMKRSRIVWNAASLDRFLANPVAVVPGTSMGYAGIPDRKERADLVAYLASAGKC
jgi:cytochrome c